MKKIVLVLLIIVSCFCGKAAPVGLEEAQMLAQKFVNSNFELSRQSEDLNLVYSMPSFYVFNVGDKGFVIISADDSYRPLIGYSFENVFEPDNMAPALQDYLNNINDERMQRGSVNADVETVRDWAMLRENGRMVARFKGKDASYLVQTKWNQNYPYNYFCPLDSNGPGGRAYAGCVATAAAQVMKYWNHPLQGTGSHSYIPEDNPQYGQQTANFGQTVYDWDNMPVSINTGSSSVQRDAVATLIYHCGVAVDMNYRPTGSGASTGYLCTVMPMYFSYTNQMDNIYREDYSKQDYLNFIFKAIDKEWPMAHRGGGHAYVLDGYDENGLVHFNWGWSGSNDAFYDIDGHNYTDGQSVIYNYVPASVYNATPNIPTNVVATANENNELAVTVSWKNPTKTIVNQNLTSLDRVVVMRNNTIVYTNDNVAPGEEMSFVDNTIPCFEAYTYRIYAVVDEHIGESAYTEKVSVGPTCQWKLVLSSSGMNGWYGAYIELYNMSGTEFKRVTLTNSTPLVVNVDMPLGPVSMVWVKNGTTASPTITINVKDESNSSVFNYSGNMANMTEGEFYSGNNTCGNEPPVEAPANLLTNSDGNNIILTWDGVSEKDGYGYNIYRDGALIRLCYTNEYVDENLSIGGHCYEVCYIGYGGPSAFSNESCCNAGEGCDTGSNLWLVVLDSYKPKITWEKPVNYTGLSGYYVYRKEGVNGDYQCVKILGANKTEYRDNSTLTDNEYYYYKVIPYYQSIDCYAAPIKAKYGNEYFVKYLYSLDAVDENLAQSVSIYPNPTNGKLKIEADGIENIMIFNLVGQKVFEDNVNSDEYVIDMSIFGSGIYMVRVQSINGSTTKKISVIE